MHKTYELIVIVRNNPITHLHIVSLSKFGMSV